MDERTDPLACAECTHSIEAHRPGDYNKDVCVALGYKQPFGGVCPCEGYAINLRALDEDPDTDVEDALDEVRAEDPNATQEEIAAIAADRVDKELLRGDNQMSDTASTEHAEDLSEDPALTHPRDHELGYHGPHDVRCDTCDARLTAAHDCAEFAQHFVNRGDESHGLECGRCGAFIQGG